jgi:ribosome-binding factor A
MKTIAPRIGRVNDILQRDLAKLIRDKCKDPRLGMVTVVGVEVTPNLAFAKIFVTVLEDEKITQSLEILNNAAGFLRNELAHIALLRIIPKLRFIYDASTVNSQRLNNLLASVIIKEDLVSADVD